MAVDDAKPEESQPSGTATQVEGDGEGAATTITFKVKSSGDHNHTITMPETSTVLDLKTKLSGADLENISADRQRLIYSGRVMKNEDSLSSYKIKAGNTIHLVKSAASNVTQQSTATAAVGQTQLPAGIPRNMAAGTEANNILAGLTGARFAGQMGLPDAGVFGADGGMGAPPDEDAMASMLEDPNLQQTINEALTNPAMIDMMINTSPMLRDNPQAREMLASPEFRAMVTNPQMIRDAARMRRQMEGMGMGGMFGGPGAAGGGASAFPAPGMTDTTPAGAPGSNAGAGTTNAQTTQPPNLGGNPFGALFNMGALGAGGRSTTGEAGAGAADVPPNPFAAIMAADPAVALFGPNGPSPEMMQNAMRVMGNTPAGAIPNLHDLMGVARPGATGGAATSTPSQPADTRPPEERFAEQLRHLNDMGFFDFERNVEALRRSGGNVEGAVENLLR